jgi:hypothetical protein
MADAFYRHVFFSGDEDMAGKRELIEPHDGDKRYERRDAQGKFSESDDLNKSLSRDKKRQAKSIAEKGQGDKGDQKKR